MKRRGFTLIELLTVIAIIVVLIGILIPVLGSVRRSAYQASTQATITAMINAIERYRQDFNAYPGPIKNSEFNATGTAAVAAKMTTTENMVVALAGGWEFGGTFNTAMVGQGPMSHSPIASARKRFGAYIDPVEGKNFPTRNPPAPTPPGDFPEWGTVAAPTIPPTPPGSLSPPPPLDSKIPEFMDAFSDPMPILYIRANVGATTTEGTAPTAQYNQNMLIPYKRLPTAGFKGDFLFNVANDPDDFGSPNEYFRDPNLQTQPRQKDGFWLISAGPDRRFGTRDDQSNFGGFR